MLCSPGWPELTILLLQSLEGRDYRCVPPCQLHKKNNLLIISENRILSIKKHLSLWLCGFYSRLPEICTLNESLKKHPNSVVSAVLC